MKKENTIPAVDSTLSALEFMSLADHPLSQNEISQAIDVSATTGYRIIQTLMKHNWVRKNTNNTFSLSLGLLPLVRKQSVFFGNLQPLLEELSQTSKLSCKLSIRQGGEQVSVLRAESPEPFAVSGKIGARFPIIEGSVGAALLSGESEKDILTLAQHCAVELPEKAAPELIFKRIESIRKLGYVFNKGNNRWRIDALSMPIVTSAKSVAGALTLIGTEEDFSSGNLPQRVKLLQKTVRKIESEL